MDDRHALSRFPPPFKVTKHGLLGNPSCSHEKWNQIKSLKPHVVSAPGIPQREAASRYVWWTRWKGGILFSKTPLKKICLFERQFFEGSPIILLISVGWIPLNHEHPQPYPYYSPIRMVEKLCSDCAQRVVVPAVFPWQCLLHHIVRSHDFDGDHSTINLAPASCFKLYTIPLQSKFHRTLMSCCQRGAYFLLDLPQNRHGSLTKTTYCWLHISCPVKYPLHSNHMNPIIFHSKLPFVSIIFPSYSTQNLIFHSIPSQSR